MLDSCTGRDVGAAIRLGDYQNNTFCLRWLYYPVLTNTFIYLHFLSEILFEKHIECMAYSVVTSNPQAPSLMIL